MREGSAPLASPLKPVLAGEAAIAEETDLNRTSLYRAFEDDGNPLFFNVLKVLSSMGLSLQVVPTDALAGKASA